MTGSRKHRRQWRYYKTRGGASPAKAFIDEQTVADQAEIFAAMQDVAELGLDEARHLRGDIWEVRLDGLNRTYRILFSAEGRFQHVLLALEGFAKKTQKTPPQTIKLAEDRLTDWRRRGKRK